MADVADRTGAICRSSWRANGRLLASVTRQPAGIAEVFDVIELPQASRMGTRLRMNSGALGAPVLGSLAARRWKAPDGLARGPRTASR